MIHCPRCNSAKLSRRHRHGWDKLLSALFNLYPFLCDDCGHCFRTRFYPPPPSAPIE